MGAEGGLEWSEKNERKGEERKGTNELRVALDSVRGELLAVVFVLGQRRSVKDENERREGEGRGGELRRRGERGERNQKGAEREKVWGKVEKWGGCVCMCVCVCVCVCA